MGRSRREYPQGRLRLRYDKNKYDKDKEYTLNYEYTWLNDAPIRKDTGLRVKVADWNPNGNSKRGELRASFGGDYKRRNTTLQDALSKYDSELQLYAQKHPHQMNSDIIRGILFDAPLTRTDEGRDFIEYVKDSLKSKLVRKKIGKSRYENGMSGMKIFSEFLITKELGTYNNKTSLYLADITPQIIDEYISYRRKIKKNHDSTINHSLTPIIAACERAANEGLIDAKLYAQIKDCRVIETPTLDDDSYDGKSYLTENQLNSLIEFYEKDSEPRRKEYIEMFLFAFNAGGMRPIDLMTLMWSNVSLENRELRKVLIKTQKGRLPRHTIPLNDAAIAILKKWKGMNRREKFVFDLVDDSLNIDDTDNLYYVRNSVVRKVNQSLDIVGQNIGLDFTLTLKVARHTFAILTLQKLKDISFVSRMLGHSTTDTTESYYAEYLQGTLKEELDGLKFDFVPESIKAEDKQP